MDGKMNKYNIITEKRISDIKLEIFDFMVKVLEKKIYLKETDTKEVTLIKTFNDLIYCLNGLKYKYTMEQDADGIMIEFEIGDGVYTFLSDVNDFNLIDYKY